MLTEQSPTSIKIWRTPSTQNTTRAMARDQY